jgi:hypothetical protein
LQGRASGVEAFSVPTTQFGEFFSGDTEYLSGFF